MNRLARFWRWARNKAGRITTSIGATLMGLEVVDLNPAKPWLTNLFSEKVADRVIAGTAAFFFALSYVRHQIVANRHPPE